MKALLIVALLLIACTPPEFESTQKVLEKKVVVPTVNVTNATQPSVTEPDNPVSKNKVYKREIKGITHTIEVIDTTSDGTGCLLKVDGMPALIDEGETSVVNGVRIYVSEVRVFNDYLQEKDLCELVIS